MEHIEQYIDKHGLTAVLEHIEGICYDKADHLATNWQDANSAFIWIKHAESIQKAVVAIRRVKNASVPV